MGPPYFGGLDPQKGRSNPQNRGQLSSRYIYIYILYIIHIYIHTVCSSVVLPFNVHCVSTKKRMIQAILQIIPTPKNKVIS